jgi:hypothetical protein
MRTHQTPELPSNVSEAFQKVTGQRLNSIKTPQELDTFLRSRPTEARVLMENGINRQVLLNQVQKGFFKKSLSALGSIAWWPVKTAGKIVAFPFKHPFITAGALAGLYFAAPHLFKLFAMPEGWSSRVGLDWLRTRVVALTKLGTAAPPGVVPPSVLPAGPGPTMM